VGSEALSSPEEPEPVGCRRPNRHAARLDAERAGEALAHLVAHVADPRLLADQDAIGVDEVPTRLTHLAVGLPQQVQRRGATVLLVAGREQRADIAEVGRTEERVDERMSGTPVSSA
jgi:hypothetical protein